MFMEKRKIEAIFPWSYSKVCRRFIKMNFIIHTVKDSLIYH